MTATPADETPPPATGFRERAKLRRRNRILRTAMRLFTERGYEATTIADIAAAAELAPRTVTGYFPNKIDLATTVGNEISDRLTAALTTSDGDDLVTVLDRWFTAEVTSDDFELTRLAISVYEANPSLAAVSTRQITAATTAGTNAIAKYLDAPNDLPAVAICAAAVGNALGTYLATLAKQGPDERLRHWFLDFLTATLRGAQLSD